MSNAQTMPAEITVTAPLVQSGTVMTPMAMIDRAISSGASVETLERLMALQERWEASEARREYNEAMTAAKAELKPIIKNRHAGFESKRTGDRTDYDYEDLPMVADTVDPILHKHGLSYRYKSKTEGLTLTVTCIVFHRRGHSEETELSSGPDTTGSKNSLQGIGSAATYLQRYTLKLALGLAARKDDDGKSAGSLSTDAITLEQYQELQGLIEKTGRSEDTLLLYLKLPPDHDVHTLTVEQYKKAKFGMTEFLRNMGRGK